MLEFRSRCDNRDRLRGWFAFGADIDERHPNLINRPLFANPHSIQRQLHVGGQLLDRLAIAEITGSFPINQVWEISPLYLCVLYWRIGVRSDRTVFVR